MMQATLQPLPQPYRVILVENDHKKIQSLLDACWEEVKPTIQVPGFGKGEAPRSIAEKKIGEEVLYKPVIDTLAKEGLSQIPQRFCLIENVSVNWQTDKTPLILYVYGFLAPEVVKCDYKSLVNNYRRLMVSDEEINANILRVAYGEAEEVEVDPTVVKDYDSSKLQVYIDFIMDDCELQKVIANQTNFKVDLSKNTFGFEAAILEHRKGEVFQVNHTLPQDFFNKDLAGRRVTYQIKIVKIYLLKLPEINDILAQKIGYADLMTMRREIAADLEAEKKKADGMLFRDHLMSLLVSQTEISPIPDVILKKEMDIMLVSAVRNANKRQQTNMSIDEFLAAAKITKEDWYNANWTLARKKFIGNLALEYIAVKENLLPTEDECRQILKDMLPENEDIDESKVDSAGLRHYVVLKKAQDFLVKLHAKPTE